MAEPTHKLYLDDSGTKEYALGGKYSAVGPTPYFVFAGLLLHANKAGQLGADLKALKRSHFGTDAVEIKANWLKRPDERKARYLDRFGIDDAKLTAFVDSVYHLIAGFDGELVASIIDKAGVQGMYADPYLPPALAYEIVLQRVQMEMAKVSGRVSVTIDDMRGATPAGNEYKDNLFRHHRLLQANGSKLGGIKMDRLMSLGFADSAADERVQLADLVAHNVYKQFVEHGKEWDEAENELEAYEYFGRIADKFLKGPNGEFTGYGVVKFPRVSNRKWSVRPKP